MRRAPWLALAAWCAATAADKGADDEILRAMRDELARSRTLKIQGTDQIYYIEYALDDVESFSATASMGALVSSSRARNRVPRVQVRVGDASFDNTNYVFADFFGRVNSRIPVEANYPVVRHQFWLATDRVFKGSLESIARKRSALRNVTQHEKLNDFAKAEPVQMYLEPSRRVWKEAEWTKLARDLSAIFVKYPKVTSSQVEIEIAYSNSYYVNSEGSEFRMPDDMFFVRVRASAQARDGMPVRDADAAHARTLGRLAGEAELRAMVERVARNVTAMLDAAAGEDYAGPVLFEDAAAPQLFAQVLGSNLAPVRRPVSEPGRTFPVMQSELEGRIGSRVLPEWMDVVDDPESQEWKGRELLGSYPVDMEAVVPRRLAVVEKGVLTHYLLTRQPVRGFEGSNGRARLPGDFGAKRAVFSNLLVTAREASPAAELKRKLIEMVNQRGKPYGMIVRKIDLPSSGSGEEQRRLSAAAGQRGGSLRPTSLPLLAWRVYPDGREEMVRGVKFRGLTARSLRDIVAASDAPSAFDFIGNGSPLPVMGAGGYVATHTVVAPAVLFEDLELEKREEDWPKLPVVEPPPLVSSR